MSPNAKWSTREVIRCRADGGLRNASPLVLAEEVGDSAWNACVIINGGEVAEHCRQSFDLLIDGRSVGSPLGR